MTTITNDLIKSLDEDALRNLWAACDAEIQARRRTYISDGVEFKTLTAALDRLIATAQEAKEFDGGPEEYFKHRPSGLHLYVEHN
jgi:hypothetical protein